MPWSVFVEGKDDKALVECLLTHLSSSHIEVVMIEGGVSKIGRIANEISRRHNDGKSIGMILDADSCLEERRREYSEEVDKYKLPIDRIFFLPDDRSEGCLETLLQQISLQEHDPVYHCFDEYERCLRKHNSAYRLPSLKGRIYAYCETVSGTKSSSVKGSPVLAACGNPSYWNFEAAALGPLLGFLDSLDADS